MYLPTFMYIFVLRIHLQSTHVRYFFSIEQEKLLIYVYFSVAFTSKVDF